MQLDDEDFDDDGPWISAAGAAARLGLPGAGALHRLIRTGELPAFRIGHVLRLRRSDVERLVASR